MDNPSPLRLHLTPSRVRVNPRIENGELVLYFRGMPLSDHRDALDVYVPSDDELPVTVEFVDFRDENNAQWTVTAAHHGTPWNRGNDRCSFGWGVTVDEIRVDVTATANGISKTKPVFLRVPPEGDRPY